MTEGLRLYVFFDEALRERHFYKTCDECKRNRDVDYRQQMGCGYEPALEAPGLIWHPAYWLKHGIKATTCPGFTTKLPEVHDVIGAYAHWEAGTLSAYLDGDEPTRPLLDALASFKAGLNEYERSKFPEAK